MRVVSLLFANFFSIRVVVVAPSFPLPSVAPRPSYEPLSAAADPLSSSSSRPGLLPALPAPGPLRASFAQRRHCSLVLTSVPLLPALSHFFRVFLVGPAPLPFAARLPRGCLPPLGVFPRWPGHV